MTAEQIEFIHTVEQSLSGHDFVKLTLGKYRGPVNGLKNIYIRVVSIKGEEHLSFLYRYDKKDITSNHPLGEGVGIIRELLGAGFLSGNLFTMKQDLQIEFNRKRESRLRSSKPTFTAPSEEGHDHRKRRYIELHENIYLRELGITNESGAVRERMGDKWRQINRYIEIVSALFETSSLSAQKEISILDMGSGKGYLTFAIYDYFTNVLGLKATVTGVEAREELVEQCNQIAQSAGFEGLRFQSGAIREYPLGEVDMLIALHACNTATDEAIFKGIAADAAIIITAPCCHQQIRPQIVPPPALEHVLKHGILLERESETVTDALRALLLEWSGYATKIFEFVSNEHTQKNTMIVGVRGKREEEKRQAIEGEISALKEFYGIKEHHLEKLLQEDMPKSIAGEE